MKGPDIIDDTLARAEKAVRDHMDTPEFRLLLAEAAQSGCGMEQRLADSLARQIRQQERVVRQVWHGETVSYIARHPRLPDEKKAVVLQEAQRTGRVREVADRNGVSRATLYRMLRKP